MLAIVRKFSLKEFRFPKEKSPDLKDFFSFAFKADQSEVVFVKK